MTSRADRTTVFIVTPVSARGGSSRSAVGVAEVLQDLGLKPVLIYGAEGAATQEARDAGFESIAVPLPRWFCGFNAPGQKPTTVMKARFLRSLGASMAQLKSLFDAHPTSFVYVNTGPAVTAIAAARMTGHAVLTHVREAFNLMHPAGRAHAQFTERNSERVIVNSHYVGEAFSGDASLRMIYNGTPFPPEVDGDAKRGEVRRLLGLQPETPLAGTMGLMNTQKGHYVMLDAIPRILDVLPEARFLLVGLRTSAAYHRSLRGRFRRLVLGQNLDSESILRERHADHAVILKEWVASPSETISALDVLVFPSIYPEGFGRPIVEAAALGKPVIAFDIGPSSELIEHNVTGILVPLGDVDALANETIRLLKDESLRKKLGKAAIDKVKEEFTEEAYRSAMREEFEAMLQREHNAQRVSISSVQLWNALQRGVALSGGSA
jgi:glycosyltransferase involved in cell wall biosynthesis